MKGYRSVKVKGTNDLRVYKSKATVGYIDNLVSIKEKSNTISLWDYDVPELINALNKIMGIE